MRPAQAPLEPWLVDLEANGVRFCVVSDRRLASVPPVAVYRSGRSRPVFTYASAAQSSVRRGGQKSTPFAECCDAIEKAHRKKKLMVAPPLIKAIEKAAAIQDGQG